MWFYYNMFNSHLSLFKEEKNATVENVITLNAWEILVQGIHLPDYQMGKVLMYLLGIVQLV